MADGAKKGTFARLMGIRANLEPVKIHLWHIQVQTVGAMEDWTINYHHSSLLLTNKSTMGISDLPDLAIMDPDTTSHLVSWQPRDSSTSRKNEIIHSLIFL